MTWGDYVGAGMTLVLFAVLVWWAVATRKSQKAYDRALIAARSLREDGLKLLEAFDHAADQLTTAGLALCAAMHSHYHLDDEALPGLITVKCMDCRETIGTVADKDDTMHLANAHVHEKFEQFRKEAARQVVQEKEEREKVKQDQV